MAILVIGGTGFIGKAVVKRVLKTEDRVVVMSRRPHAFSKDILARVDSVTGDVRLFPDVIRIIRDYKIDNIIHTAFTLTKATAENPFAATETNVLGTSNVFEAARIFGARRVVFCSSLGVYSSQESYGDRAIKEDEKLLNPVCLYGAAKLFNEFLASSFEIKYGLEIPLLRIAGVYGIGTEKNALMSWPRKIAAAAVRGESVSIPINPEEPASFIHVEDVAEQLVRLCTQERLEYRIYNSGGYTATPEMFRDIVRKYYPDAKIEFDENAPSWWPYPQKLDGERIAKELNWEIRDPESGLLDMMNHERLSLGLGPLEKIFAPGD
jgi:nucleoside-diphosphate-sugar epimerase